MIELLAGALTGAAMTNKSDSHNWGTLIIVLDPAEFTTLEEFQIRAGVMCERVKNAKRLEGVEQITLPGERGDEVERMNRERGTIELPLGLYEKLTQL
jgi:LDH2 family malate/lactate/ureidoglycolate dehydrogenase